MTCKYGLDEAIYREDSFRRRSVSLTEMNDSPTQSLVSSLGPKYTVLIISDMHYGKSGHSQHEDELLSWIDSLPASKRPAFCINLGDTADHGLPGELDSFLAFESRLKQRIPNVYNIVGNHDLYNSGWSGWKEKMYPHNSFYHFETSAFSWYFLDSGSGTLGKRQMDEFEKVLRNDSKQKIVSLHYPIYSDKISMLSCGTLQDEHEANRLVTLFLDNKVALVLDGHTHRYFRNDFGSFLELNVSTMMKQCSFALVTVDEESGIVDGRGLNPEEQL